MQHGQCHNFLLTLPTNLENVQINAQYLTPRLVETRPLNDARSGRLPNSFVQRAAPIITREITNAIQIKCRWDKKCPIQNNRYLRRECRSTAQQAMPRPIPDHVAITSNFTNTTADVARSIVGDPPIPHFREISTIWPKTRARHHHPRRRAHGVHAPIGLQRIQNLRRHQVTQVRAHVMRLIRRATSHPRAQ